ncbi:MAG: methylenetetrahydrofolate reductase, partial [Deltaproteobacteria bacterium]|nr:methylenetetrahydrofolate reductase [Deltaproteobacteria bacterium]
MPTPFKEALESGKFVVTSEVAPPKGTNLEKFKHHIELLKDTVDAMNVTDHQSSVMRFPSLGGCLLVKELGGEVILQMTCRDRNRLALQADLLFASSRGIQNVLCLTGDSIVLGDHKDAKSVFDMDSSQLLETVRTLENGKDLGGNELDG